MSDPPVSADPRSRGVILLSFHRAALDLYGKDGLRQIGGRLSEGARVASIDEAPLALGWYPTSYCLEWWDAVFEGPAGRDEKRHDLFVDRCNELGFGRVRKALLSFVGPEGLVARASELWRHDHTHGSLTIVEPLASGVRALLRDHPFVTTPRARRSIAEALRYILSLARGVKRVTETHAMKGDGGLVIQFVWE